MIESISKSQLYWRKTNGCYRQFGLIETFRRTVRELIRSLRKSNTELDLSPVTKELAIGAAPRSFLSIQCLRALGFTHVIDLRAERKERDLLVDTKEPLVEWIPMYDDWRPKPTELYRKLQTLIEKVLSPQESGKLFICCGAGEHRAPLAGTLALVIMGHSTERAISMVIQARPQSELLPAYKASLIEFLRERPGSEI